MRVIDIVRGTTVDGPGFRTSIYFAGCDEHCQGCHNPQTWDHGAGREMSIGEIVGAINEEDFNVTFSGGDPLCQIDQLIELAQMLKRDGRDIWCYTGRTFENLLKWDKFLGLAPYVDVVVDGPYIENLRDIDLQFRGSSNQRIIDVGMTLDSGQIVDWKSTF